jgi:hypothetical protein
MKKLIVVLAAISSSSCAAGVSPELYAVILDFFRPGTSCYSSGTFPSNDVTASSPQSLRVEIYDWSQQSDNKAFLEIVSGGVTVDMGDARPVILGGLFEGTRPASADQPTAFLATRTVERTVSVLGMVAATLTDVTSATLNLTRGRTFQGTLELKSSTTCVGSGCPANIPQCTISGINVRGTQLEVEYQQEP